MTGDFRRALVLRRAIESVVAHLEGALLEEELVVEHADAGVQARAVVVPPQHADLGFGRIIGSGTEASNKCMSVNMVWSG